MLGCGGLQRRGGVNGSASGSWQVDELRLQREDGRDNSYRSSDAVQRTPVEEGRIADSQPVAPRAKMLEKDTAVFCSRPTRLYDTYNDYSVDGERLDGRLPCYHDGHGKRIRVL